MKKEGLYTLLGTLSSFIIINQVGFLRTAKGLTSISR